MSRVLVSVSLNGRVTSPRTLSHPNPTAPSQIAQDLPTVAAQLIRLLHIQHGGMRLRLRLFGLAMNGRQPAWGGGNNPGPRKDTTDPEEAYTLLQK
jgi:hypothetical protein